MKDMFVLLAIRDRDHRGLHAQTGAARIAGAALARNKVEKPEWSAARQTGAGLRLIRRTDAGMPKKKADRAGYRLKRMNT
jgi:hypothetical protein